LSLNCKIVELILINPELYRTIIIVPSNNNAKENDNHAKPRIYHNKDEKNEPISRKKYLPSNMQNNSYLNKNEIEIKNQNEINNKDNIDNSRERLNKNKIDEKSKPEDYTDNMNLNYKEIYNMKIYSPKNNTHNKSSEEVGKYLSEQKDTLKSRERLNCRNAYDNQVNYQYNSNKELLDHQQKMENYYKQKAIEIEKKKPENTNDINENELNKVFSNTSKILRSSSHADLRPSDKQEINKKTQNKISLTEGININKNDKYSNANYSGNSYGNCYLFKFKGNGNVNDPQQFKSVQHDSDNLKIKNKENSQSHLKIDEKVKICIYNSL